MSGLFGGGSQKTDRNQTLASYGQMNNLFNFGFNQGKNRTEAGNQNLDAASSYWRNILSGNRASQAQAVAPAANAIQSSGDALRRQREATGTARGGGTAATGANAQDNEMTQINNAILGERPAAASQTGALGGQDIQAAMEALGLGESAAGANLSGSITSRPTSSKIGQDSVKNAMNLAGNVLDAMPGKFPEWLTAILG